MNEQDLILEDNKQIFRVTIECVQGENEGRDIYKEFVVTDGLVPEKMEVLLQEMVDQINDDKEVF